MTTHPYLRAFMAGGFVPIIVLPLALAVFIFARIVMQLDVPIEQAMIFPMAVVPTLFGLWNMLYLRSQERTHLPLGLHGAILPLLMAPAGALVASGLGVLQFGASGVTWFEAWHIPYGWIALGFAPALAGYYLIWKYVVGFLNRTLEIG